MPFNFSADVRRLTIGFCLLAAVLGAVQAWSSRFAMNPDGIQYLDNATLYLGGDFRHAVNSQWSPLYPWLIGAIFAIVRPGPYQEFPVVHLLNFLLYMASLGGFLFFVAPLKTRGVGLLAVSYGAFLCCSLDFTNLTYVTPDLLVSTFAYLAAGFLLRIAAAATLSQCFALGLVLGIGYLAKAPFLLFGALCVGIVAVLVKRWIPVAVTVLAFAMICLPYIGILSDMKGRLTYGDSGRLNLIWMVNGVSLYHWQGGPPNGNPVHPTRQVSANPDIFEFAAPVAGTYPPWYDPSYWNDGAKIALRPGDFARAVVKQIRLYAYWIHHRQLPLVFGVLALLLLVNGKIHWKPFWPILLFAAVPFAMYALIHAESRYLAPFFVILWTALFAILSDKADAIMAVTAVLMVVETLLTFAEPIIHTPPRLQYEIAQGLDLKRGENVAIFSGDLGYDWARLAGAHIVLEVSLKPQACTVCGQREIEWKKAKTVLAANRAKLVVSPCISGIVDQPGWQQIGKTGVFAYRFD